jgi:hypothetical protein
MDLEQWWNYTDRGILKYAETKLDPVPISTTNPACTGLDSNQDLCCERPATTARIMARRQDSDSVVHSITVMGFSRTFFSRFSRGSSKFYPNLEIKLLSLLENYQCFGGNVCLHLYCSTMKKEIVGSTEKLALV